MRSGRQSGGLSLKLARITAGITVACPSTAGATCLACGIRKAAASIFKTLSCRLIPRWKPLYWAVRRLPSRHGFAWFAIRSFPLAASRRIALSLARKKHTNSKKGITCEKSGVDVDICPLFSRITKGFLHGISGHVVYAARLNRENVHIIIGRLCDD